MYLSVVTGHKCISPVQSLVDLYNLNELFIRGCCHVRIFRQLESNFENLF